jgi:hypothetical protein
MTDEYDNLSAPEWYEEADYTDSINEAIAEYKRVMNMDLDYE